MNFKDFIFCFSVSCSSKEEDPSSVSCLFFTHLKKFKNILPRGNMIVVHVVCCFTKNYCRMQECEWEAENFIKCAVLCVGSLMEFYAIEDYQMSTCLFVDAILQVINVWQWGQFILLNSFKLVPVFVFQFMGFIF